MLMAEDEKCQKLRDGLRAVRGELEEILNTLSSETGGSVDEARDMTTGPPAADAPTNFFAEITQGDQAPDERPHRVADHVGIIVTKEVLQAVGVHDAFRRHIGLNLRGNRRQASLPRVVQHPSTGPTPRNPDQL